MKRANASYWWLGLCGCLLLGTAARADDDGTPPAVGGILPDWVSLSGYIRPDLAIKTSGRENPFNQRGNLFNGVAVARTGFTASDVTTRDGVPADNTLDLALLRTELDASLRFSSQFSLTAKLRGAFDPALYHEYDPAQVNSQAVGAVYGQPSYFKYDVQGSAHPQPLEWAGRNYQIYFPALFLEYSNGPLDVRLGNQQIAWGQAIFFRVLDVPDGLDLRRHSALDYASEEFSDKRVPAPALRVLYQVSEHWLSDFYTQKFQPTVYGNPNTQYNAIPSQFTVHDTYADYDSKMDYGLRVKGDFGDIGVQGMAVRRYNPDGVYRWTASNVNRDLPGAPGSGAVLAQTPFEVDPTGVWSSAEWFTYAGMARLNGLEGLNAAVRDFPAAALLGAAQVPTYALARQELDTFFQASGSGLRGHIAREYRAETDLGGGASYVVSAAPGSLLDQLIVNVEALYVPDRTFTDPSLGAGFLRKHEWTTALVMEKYQRFSAGLPATYLVFQWLHKTESDLFGRYLGGMGGDVSKPAPGYGGGYNAFALALQQPFPSLIWRADFAALYDPKGGLLLQPAVRWKPNGRFTVEAFYNYIDGHLGTPTNNALSTFDYASEVTLRLGYQF